MFISAWQIRYWEDAPLSSAEFVSSYAAREQAGVAVRCAV
jgi:hypothetical protein